MNKKYSILLSISLVLNLAAITWIALFELGIRSVRFQTADVSEISTQAIIAKTAKLGKMEAFDTDGVYAVINRSSLTGSGGMALLDRSEKQTVILSEGFFALSETTRENEKEIGDISSNYKIYLATSKKGGTIKINGTDNSSLVLNSGETLIDPLDILGAHLVLRSPHNSTHIDAKNLNRN